MVKTTCCSIEESYRKNVINKIDMEYKKLLDKYNSLKFYQIFSKKFYLCVIDKYGDLLNEKLIKYENILEEKF